MLDRLEISEDTVVAQLKTYVEATSAVTSVPLDVNRGIKYIWDNDIIDSPRVRAKKPRSTSQETMDAGLYLKREEPQRYAELIQDPLLKAIFYCMQRPEELGRKFVCDATNGRFSFTSYSQPLVIENVIRLVLQHN